MAHIRSKHRDDFGTEIRWPAVLGAIAAAAAAVVLSVGSASLLAVVLAGLGVVLK